MQLGTHDKLIALSAGTLACGCQIVLAMPAFPRKTSGMSQIKSVFLPLTLTAIFAAVIFATLLSGSDARAQDAPKSAWAGQKWEYRALRIPDRRQTGARERDLRARRSGSQEVLNQIGAEGWELVAVRNDSASDPVFYFKRPKS